MSTHTHVPADDDATSLVDLVDDCRHLAFGATRSVIDLTARIPHMRAAGDHARHLPGLLTDRVAHLVDGFGEYGGA